MFRRHPSARTINANTCRRADASLDRSPKGPRRRGSSRCKTVLGPGGRPSGALPPRGIARAPSWTRGHRVSMIVAAFPSSFLSATPCDANHAANVRSPFSPPTDLRSAFSLRNWPFVRLPSSIPFDDARSMILSPLSGSDLQTDYSCAGADRLTRLPPCRSRPC